MGCLNDGFTQNRRARAEFIPASAVGLYGARRSAPLLNLDLASLALLHLCEELLLPLPHL